MMVDAMLPSMLPSHACSVVQRPTSSPKIRGDLTSRNCSAYCLIACRIVGWSCRSPSSSDRGCMRDTIMGVVEFDVESGSRVASLRGSQSNRRRVDEDLIVCQARTARFISLSSHVCSPLVEEARCLIRGMLSSLTWLYH